MSSSTIGRKLVLSAMAARGQQKLIAQVKEKAKKPALLTKIFNANAKRTISLLDILKDPNSISRNSINTDNMNEDEFLKKYNETPKRGPKYSIAQNRAHHLTNFLSEFIINAFQSGQFQLPEIPEYLNQSFTDSNGFYNEKYSFEISNVELPNDLTKLKIFWLISGIEEVDVEIEKYLERKLKNEVRSTLTTQRIMSYVPEVEFVRDNSKLLKNKLEEYLFKIKIENEKANLNNEKSSETPIDTEPIKTEKTKNKLVDNLYGVNVGQLMKIIKKDNDHVPWSEDKEKTNESTLTISSTINQALSKQIADLNKADNSKFELNLKAFKLNQRLKHKRLNKTALLKLASLEFNESFNKKVTLNEDEE